jgi:phosphoglycerate kinase
VIGHPRFIAPNDVTAQRSDGHAYVKKPHEVTADDKIVDIGPDSVALIAPHIERANFILWNGPTGLYEEGFTAYTHAIAEIIAKRVALGAHSVIGGGDTIAAIQENGMQEGSLGFLSTGGGAMLEFLAKGTLPGIEALRS